ncbi:amidohydrolase family protein [Microbacterium sp. zg-Y818]|uniref:amidohydrolase family protein n=1 Tax=unclassified Microbacterium TaxID=2609290 RepID=UPI00214AED2F|nr:MULTISPECIES: amidohydrolase family protein [unclassified Microbacterium]MCR2799571.1 amidohydrolase family protein [Microbacterium sp. zg.Y818]WIM21565.1 amidohydrolase family protein [Microbacterium sp. zg-Y818]
MPDSPNPQAGQPVLFKDGIVLTMDDAHTVLPRGDVLVKDGVIVEVGVDVPAPEGVCVIDASGGIVMPGMVDTHRHMWQTAMRAYGADWTLTQYFVWYYLQHGAKFRPQDYAAGNLISALDAIESGVTTSVDWSHGLRTIEHGEAAYDALVSSPGRFVFAYGNIHRSPWEWTADPDIQRLLAASRDDSRMFGTQIAFDVPNQDEQFPELAAYQVAKELGLRVTTHAGVWGATNDWGIRNAYAAGVMEPGFTYVHAASLSEESYQMIAATGGNVSLATESEDTCGQGYPPLHQLRRHGIPTSLSVDTSVWFSADLFSAMRATVNADRVLEHYQAHRREPAETVTHVRLRAEDVVHMATRGGAQALGKDDVIGSLQVGKLGDVVLLKNEDSPTWAPLINPWGQIVYQAQRGDVHTVLVGGEVVKWNGKVTAGDLRGVRTKLDDTVAYLEREVGDDWVAGQHPDIPEAEVLTNPYQYKK